MEEMFLVRVETQGAEEERKRMRGDALILMKQPAPLKGRWLRCSTKSQIIVSTRNLPAAVCSG